MNGEDTVTIVAVHGVGNSFGAEISSEQKEELRAIRAASWTRHLAEGLGVPSDHIHLDFAYYADKLLPGIVEQGTAALDELDDPLEQQMLAAWAAHLGVPPEIAQGRLTAPLRQITAWVADRFDLAEGPLKVFIRLLFREVAAYLREHDSPHRLAARDEVAARIAQEQPRIVIAHSLGSVVAYEALHAHPELRPELFLTLGSPLALPRAVFHRLSPTPAGPGPNPQGQRPPGVSRWINIADPGDPVAIPPHLARYFKGITKDHTAAIARYDFHQAKNYLRSAATAATINPYLTTRGSRS
ncbi:serine peptidase [Streptomyces roseirectus]|uniref:Serine peptidase n=1 Tax=Streptomyces roseirectus TaxID=2768066 RepID=A0A7H0I8B3_9ACTN|nr:serine peptidase [Streptomyces roseirectus]QNP69029.1 serine peptidase [Streptomyces roseirectus]